MPAESPRSLKDVIAGERECMWNEGFLYVNIASNKDTTLIKIVNIIISKPQLFSL